MPTANPMPYGRVPGLDKPISRLVQGAAMLGGGISEVEGFALLDSAFEQGCSAFDTAHIYAGGESERVLGRWVRQRNVRDRVVIITKGAHPSGGRKRVTPADINSDLGESLERLETDSIDLYLLHRDDPEVPVEPIIDVLTDHQRAGRIKVFGASNWSYQRIRAANAYARANGLEPFAASSVNLSLAEQIEAPWAGCLSISGVANAAERRWYSEQQMPLFAWSSLAGGFFSGRYRPDNRDSLESDADQLCLRAYGSQANFQRLARAGELGAERGLTAVQVALAYVMAQPLNIFALVGPLEPDMFAADVQALHAHLTPPELAWLDLSADQR